MFEYRTGLPGYSKFTYYQLAPGYPPYQYYQARSHYNAAGLKDTMIQDWYSGWMVIYNVAEYNAFGNPTVVTKYSINQDSTIYTREKLYNYYELYDAPLGVPAGNKPLSAVRVFPNPATNQITIAFGVQRLAGPVRIDICNMMGQIVQTQTLEQPSGDVAIRLGEVMSAGVYGVSVIGSRGEVYKGTFLKE